MLNIDQNRRENCCTNTKMGNNDFKELVLRIVRVSISMT